MTFSAEFAKSFVKAHGAMPKLIKDSTNPHFRSQYASLAAVIDAIRKPLADNGLALYQHATTTTDDTGKPLAVVRSMLIHESGEYIEDELPMPVQKNDAQGIGSAITYGRRYAAMAICGLAPDDDDGNEATQPQQPQKQPQRQNGNGKQPVKQQPQPERTIETARSAFHAIDILDTHEKIVETLLHGTSLYIHVFDQHHEIDSSLWTDDPEWVNNTKRQRHALYEGKTVTVLGNCDSGITGGLPEQIITWWETRYDRIDGLLKPIPPTVAEWMNATNAAEAAKAWAVEIGAQHNAHAARNSMAKIVNEQFGGKFTDQNKNDVLTAYYFRQQEKLAGMVETVEVETAEPVAA